MNWKHRVSRHLLFALLGGVAATSICWGLLYTRTLHGLAVSAFTSADEFIFDHLDPTYLPRSQFLRSSEEFAVNVVLYAFWIFVALAGIDLLRQLKRKTGTQGGCLLWWNVLS
jgi:hypothetical protein